MAWSMKTVLQLIRFYPPYLTAGISVCNYNKDITSITVQMNMRPWNKNYVGTHFGGSLYSMCDPWYMFILIHYFGSDYIIWDKSAQINFVSPGKGTVRATFSISKQQFQDIQMQVQDNQKYFPVFETKIIDAQEKTIAYVTKELYIRKKRII